MDTIILLSKVLGSFFYQSPVSEQNQQLINALAQEQDEVNALFAELVAAYQQTEQQDLIVDHQQLFEGLETMPAPPWGSVYLDKEKVLFGDSTLRYRNFLRQQAISLDTGLREPEDQFGLMLLAMAQLIESGAEESVIKTLLSEHLLPWAPHYLELTEQHAQTEFYRQLARFSQTWLSELKQHWSLTPLELKIH